MCGTTASESGALADAERADTAKANRSNAKRTLDPPTSGLLVEQALVAFRIESVLNRLGHEAPADPRVARIAREVDRGEHQRLAVCARLIGTPREDTPLADRRLARRLGHLWLRLCPFLCSWLRRRRRLLRRRLLRDHLLHDRL